VDESARRFFDGLPNSLQRYHVDNIKDAKTPETRQRRIDKAVTPYLAGRKRSARPAGIRGPLSVDVRGVP